MKIKIINNGMNTRDCKVFIDGHDVTENLTEIDVKIKGGEIPTLKLAFVPDEILIEGDYEVLKKITEEKKDKEIINYCEFSYKWIKENAKKIMGNVDTNIELMNFGIVKIKVNCEQEDKYNKFRRFISKNKPLGVTVLLERHV